MDDASFNRINRRFLDLIVDDSDSIRIVHSRVLGPLCMGGDLVIADASRKILNDYSFSVPAGRDYFLAFDLFKNILENLVRLYSQQIVKGTPETIDWDTPKNGRYEKLVGVNFTKDEFGDFHHYTLKGDLEKRSISVYSDVYTLDCSIYSLLQKGEHDTKYSVLVSPGEPHEFEREISISGMVNNFIKCLQKNKKVIYVPLKDWAPPGLKEHKYQAENEAFKVTFFGD